MSSALVANGEYMKSAGLVGVTLNKADADTDTINYQAAPLPAFFIYIVIAS